MNILKVLHLLWAGFWSLFILYYALPEVQFEPHLIGYPLLASVWMICALALLFDYGWAWYGSFVCSLIWLFLIVYLLWMQFASLQDDIQVEGTRLFWKYEMIRNFEMLTIATLSASVTAALLHTRHRILKDRFNEWSVQFARRNKRLLWGIVAVIFLFVLTIACVVWHYDL